MFYVFFPLRVLNTFFLPPSLSLSLSLTHTYTRTHARVHTHTHTYTNTWFTSSRLLIKSWPTKQTAFFFISHLSSPPGLIFKSPQERKTRRKVRCTLTVHDDEHYKSQMSCGEITHIQSVHFHQSKHSYFSKLNQKKLNRDNEISWCAN